jgi:hypothetical protein
MKKFTMTALVIGVALLLAAPAMAVDIAWDGHLRVRGYVEKNVYQDDADDYSAWYDMRMRTNWTLAVSDYLTIRTRWRAMNQVGGGADADATNFDWERAWMSIKTPYGVFEAGKMITKTFGTTFVDNETDIFRLNYVTKLMDKLTLVVTAQKAAEGDQGFTISDQDVDVYGFALVYPTENWTIGSLQVWLRQRAGGADADRYSANPYFTGKFGNLGLQAEGLFWFGSTDQASAPGLKAAAEDGDYKAWALNAEATYDLGMASIMLGAAYATGDDDPNDGDIEYVEFGDDWEKTWILFGSTGLLPETIGNFSTTGGDVNGFWTVYGGADTNITEKLNIGAIVAYAQVLEEGDFDDKAGIEVNLRATWNIYDNLSYNAIAAMLFSGDYFEDKAAAVDPANSNDDAPWALFHVLQLNF